ncbi:MAG: adenylate kinase [Bacteroidales bacterium]
MFNIILFGPPGAGKGTQSGKIARDFHFVHLSTGQILRTLVEQQTAIGQLIKKFIDRGYLVPDDIVLRELFREAQRHHHRPGLIFDGFPRTVYQAEKLDQMLEKKGMPISMVISLEVEQHELYRRIMGRSVDSGRSDDVEEVIRQRFRTYEEETLPLREYFLESGRLVHISGMAPADEVYGEIKDQINQRIKGKRAGVQHEQREQ